MGTPDLQLLRKQIEDDNQTSMQPTPVSGGFKLPQITGRYKTAILIVVLIAIAYTIYWVVKRFLRSGFAMVRSVPGMTEYAYLADSAEVPKRTKLTPYVDKPSLGQKRSTLDLPYISSQRTEDLQHGHFGHAHQHLIDKVSNATDAQYYFGKEMFDESEETLGKAVDKTTDESSFFYRGTTSDYMAKQDDFWNEHRVPNIERDFESNYLDFIEHGDPFKKEPDIIPPRKLML